MSSEPGTSHARPRSAKVATVTDTLYFTPAQWDKLQARTRSTHVSAAKLEQMQMAACSFIAAVGAKLGLPQRTIGTAQLLYQRFHLFESPVEYSLHSVALTCLFTSAKLNDTQKRVHEMVLASYVFRFPELVVPPTGDESGDWLAHAHLLETELDQDALHREQAHIVSLERRLLQCVCFNFQLRSPRILTWVVKLARNWHISRAWADVAWRMACDSHRTHVAWMYTPVTVALGCVYACGALQHAASIAAECAAPFERAGEYTQWHVSIDDIADVALSLLRLYDQHAPALGIPDKRARIPAHVVYPPPLGLLFWRMHVADVRDTVTQAQIWIRQDASRLSTDSAQQRYADAARRNDSLASSLLTPEPKDAAHVIATRYTLPL